MNKNNFIQYTVKKTKSVKGIKHTDVYIRKFFNHEVF